MITIIIEQYIIKKPNSQRSLVFIEGKIYV